MSGQADAYAVLGVSPETEDVVVRAAYRALKEKYSGADGSLDAWDEQRAREIEAAYEVLRDPRRRRAYDRSLDAAPPPAHPPSSTAFSPAPPSLAATPAPVPLAPLVARVPPRDPAVAPAARPAGRATAPRRRGAPGGAVAALAGLVGLGLVGWLATRSHSPAPAPQSRGLTISKRYAASAPVATRPLPCYVDGRPVGQLRLRDCASRNGVATGPLDVGLDGPEQAGATPISSRPPPRERTIQARPAVAPPGPDRGEPIPPPPASEAPPPRGPEESVAAVRAFYAALAAGDGDSAARLVEPEKRGAGPLSAAAMSRFYGALAEPLRLTQIYTLDPATVFVRYRFVTRGGRACRGAANVVTTERDGQILVRGIRAYNGC